MIELDFNITIVGLGLIGGSFAMAIKELKPKNLWAVDINEAVIKAAEDKGIIDKGYTEPKLPLEESDIVIMCVYPSLTTKFVRDNIDNFKSGAIITDTVGIKEKLIGEIHSFIREDLDFVGGHPMAGREHRGFEFASKEIFKDASYIITPTDRNIPKNIEIIEGLVRKIGFTNISKLDPGKHDEIIAFTSHLPHLLAVALITSGKEYDIKHLIAGSFKDATRVARINSELWTELVMDNDANVIAQLEILEKNIADIKKSVMNRENSTLKSIFDKGRVKREELI